MSPGRASPPAPSISSRRTSPRSRDLLRATTNDPLVVAAASSTVTATSASACPLTTPRRSSAAPGSSSKPTRGCRTFGRNQLHISQVAGWCEVDRPLLEVAPAPSDDLDARIAAHVAARIPDGATIQSASVPSPTPSWPRCEITATSASTPSCCPTASSTSSKPASSTASASTSTAPSRRHVRPRHRPLTVSSTTTRPSSCGRSATSTTLA